MACIVIFACKNDWLSVDAKAFIYIIHQGSNPVTPKYEECFPLISMAAAVYSEFICMQNKEKLIRFG